MAAKQKRGGRGGARPGAGRPTGYVLKPATRERIQSGMALDVVHKAARGELKGDPKRVALRLQAATTLLRKTLPDLTATDITSKGEAITVVRRSFKRPEQQPKANGENKHVDASNGGSSV